MSSLPEKVSAELPAWSTKAAVARLVPDVVVLPD
jgi:hypothetical protein